MTTTNATFFALMQLFLYLGGPTWIGRPSWGNSSVPVCQWEGISCDASSKVIELQLNSILTGDIGSIGDALAALQDLVSIQMCCGQLYGTLPNQLVALNGTLTMLDLQQNQLSGPLTVVEQLPLLQELYLNQNMFSGTLPSAACMNIQELWLFNNQLSGTIPDSWNHMANADTWLLSSNRLRGSLPSWLPELKALQYLFIDNNDFEGSVDAVMATTGHLLYASLRNNRFSGSLKIPAMVQNGALTNLYLDNNNISGTIPPSLFTSYPSLSEVSLNQNQFRGTVNFSLLQLLSSTLTKLQISNNNLEGTIGSEIGTLLLLDTVTMSHNKLSGTVPATTGHLSSLFFLDLSYNNLRGTIPPQLCLIPRIGKIFLGFNSLEGRIPSGFGTMRGLTSLSLASNNLTGYIPEGIASNVSVLDYLQLSNNPGLTGTIPSSIGQLHNLASLYLENTGLSGTIPSELAGLSSVVTLDLSNNALHGTIPSSLGNLASLVTLRLSGNKLSGSLPSSFMKLWSLSFLYLANNKFNSSINDFLYPLAHKEEQCRRRVFSFLCSTITPSTKCSQLTIFHLPENALTGEMSPYINAFVGLSSMQLQRNQISGTLPSIGQYFFKFCDGTGAVLSSPELQLVELDLSDNRGLVGTVPESFASLPSLATLSLTGTSMVSPDRSLPTFLQFQMDQLYSVPDRNANCPKITGRASQIVVSLNPQYFNYEVCICRTNYFGKNGNCYECPNECTCDFGAVKDCWPVSDSLLMPCPKTGSTTTCNPDMNASFSCGEGYVADSLLCSKCEDGYFLLSRECRQCPSYYRWLLPLAWPLYVAGIVGLSFYKSSSGQNAGSSAVVPITIFHFQIISILAISTPARSAASSVNEASNIVNIHIWAVDCLFSGSQWWVSFVITVLFPFVFIIIIVVMYYFMENYSKSPAMDPTSSALPTAVPTNDNPASRTRRISIQVLVTEIASGQSNANAIQATGCFIFLLDLWYFGAATEIMNVLACTIRIEDGNRTFLQTHPYFECTGKIYTILGTVSSLGFIVYVIGYPLLQYAILRTRLRQNSLESADTLSTYGFLYARFRKDAVFWNLAITFRRIAIAATLVFVPYYQQTLKYFFIYIILQSSLFMQQTYIPYKSSLDNRLEAMSLLTLVISFVCAIIVQLGGSLGNGMNSTALALNAVVGAILVCSYAKEAFSQRITKIRQLFSRRVTQADTGQHGGGCEKDMPRDARHVVKQEESKVGPDGGGRQVKNNQTKNCSDNDADYAEKTVAICRWQWTPNEIGQAEQFVFVDEDRGCSACGAQILHNEDFCRGCSAKVAKDYCCC